MKVLKTVLVNHSVKTPINTETRFYATDVENPKVGDVFAVWAHGVLMYARVKKVYETYEYLASENGGVVVDDLPDALNRIDFDAYKVKKAARAATKRLEACLAERIAEGKRKNDVQELIKPLKGEAKAEVQAIVDAIAAIKADPASALAMQD